MEKYCRRCGNDVPGRDANGNVQLVYYCIECHCYVGEPTLEEARDMWADMQIEESKMKDNDKDWDDYSID